MKQLLFGILLAVCGMVVNGAFGATDGAFRLIAVALAGIGLLSGAAGLLSKSES